MDYLKEIVKFEDIYNNCINGNLRDFQNQVNKLSKKQLFNFFIFLQDSQVNNYTYKQVSRALNKDYK